MNKQTVISIVTACYNMEEFIESTLKSITSQLYSNLEYIIVDGRSTDNTVNIINRYSNRIANFIREKDNGQYFAIQKGFQKSSGEIMAWLNADDIYMPWTLSVVNEIFNSFKEVDWIIGSPTYINEKGQCSSCSSMQPVYPQMYVKNGWFRSYLGGYLQQESMFWRRSLWNKVQGLDLSLSFASDFKLWTEFAKHADPVSISIPLAAFRHRPGKQRSSYGRDIYESEVANVCNKLPNAPIIWDYIAKRGVRERCLCRLGIWKKGRVIGYSKDSSTWNLRTMYRPISRRSFSSLLFENSIL